RQSGQAPTLKPGGELTSEHLRGEVTDESKGMTTGEVADAVKDVLKGFPRVMSRTTVVATEKELPVHIRSRIDARSAGGRVRGVFDPVGGRIYLVSANLDGPHDAVATLIHEAVGEYGIDNVLGRQDWEELRKALLL